MLTIKSDELLIQDEQQLVGMVLNQRSTQRFSVNTEIDFVPTCRTVVKKSKNDNAFLVIYDALKKSEGGTPTESRVPIGMLLRCPFQAENRKPMEKQSTLQDALLACLDKPNPGLEAWRLVKGRRIKVVRNATCKDRPFGATEDCDVEFNIFDYA